MTATPTKIMKRSTASAKTKKSRKKPRGKPKRPLSAYNFFFRAERYRMVSEALNNSADEFSPEEMAEALKSGRNRPHRKTHGKVSFHRLTKEVAEKWKTISVYERSVYQEKADQDYERYKEALAVWKTTPEGRVAIQDQKEQLPRPPNTVLSKTKSPRDKKQVAIVKDKQVQAHVPQEQSLEEFGNLSFFPPKTSSAEIGSLYCLSSVASAQCDSCVRNFSNTQGDYGILTNLQELAANLDKEIGDWKAFLF